MKKLLSILLIAIMAVSLFAGCSGKPASSTSGSDSPAFKLGASGPLTGGAAIYGVSAKNGATIAVEEINALGGSIRFELNYQDDEADAEKAVNAYNTLKDWGAQITLGTVTSGSGAAVSPLSFEDRLFALTPSASSTTVTEGNDNVFQMCFTDPNQGFTCAQYTADKKLGTKIAIIYKNDDNYSKGLFESFVAKAEELGLDIVYTGTFTGDSENDFTVQLKGAQSKGADFVFLPIYYTPASLIFKQAADIGYEPKYFGVDGMDGILTLEGFDTGLAEGVMFFTPFNAASSDELTSGFVEAYRQKFGEDPNQFAADGYDSVFAIYEAIKSSNGAITPEQTAKEICEALIAIFNGSFTFNGVTGSNMSWDVNGEVSKAPAIVVIKDGAYADMK